MINNESRTAVFTIASENYFAQVQTLLKSLQNTNPSWDRYFAVVDEPDGDLLDAIKRTDSHLIKMDEIGIPDLDDMKFRYTVLELNTAIKPFVMLTLQDKYDRVVYLDPDICVYDEMEAINNAFDEGYDFIITPHFSDYFEENGTHPNEPDIMRAGIYNFGFFAVSNSFEAKRAVKWWAERLETLCINRSTEGIFVDQKWMDLLPGRHDKIYFLRNSGYNTAYWNLSHRKATYQNGRFFFNGEPLIFFHFSGFNPTKPDSISKHQNRYTMDDIGVAKKLFLDYAKEVLDNEYSVWNKKSYSFNRFNDGRPISDIFRILYRENKSIEEAARPRNPFNCSDLFYDNKKQIAPMIINQAIRDHQEAGVYFINFDRNKWVDWMESVLRNEYKLDDDWVKYVVFFFSRHLSTFRKEKVVIRSETTDKNVSENGVNLIGYIRSEHGIGEACRLTADALSTTSIPWSAYDWEVNNPSSHNDNTWNAKISQSIKYNISIFNINADQLPVAYSELPKAAWNGYRIGIWYWELTRFPSQWRNSFDLVNEIWAPTRFIQENLEKESPVPVLYMPPGIRRDKPRPDYDRAYFGLPSNVFLFLNFYDALSYTSRKNPEAAVRAFQMAFSADDMSVGLVLKVNNVSDGDEGVRALHTLISDYKNIYVIAKTISRDEVNSLINCCDASVSLHRSEGLGLLCEESMYYGKPVIATGWSGNMDYMTEENSCLVKYSLVPIGDYYGMNDSDQTWAEPDLGHAAEYMIRLKDDHEFYERVSQNAKDYIHREFSSEKCGQRMQKRLSELIREKGNWKLLENKREAETETTSLEEDYNNMSMYHQVRYYRELSGNPVKVFIKKVIRKIAAPIIVPMTSEQAVFNASVTRLLQNEIKNRSTMFISSFDEVKKQYESISSEITEIKAGTTEIKAGTIEIENQIKNNQSLSTQTAEHYIQSAGSLYNAIFQKVSSIDKTLAGNNSNSSGLLKDFIEDKWRIIDKYYHEPEQMICCICENQVVTATSEKLKSEDIFGGGVLIRYRCPHCGAIIGPNKMWELTENELSEEYRYHYMINDEGTTTEAEIETFMQMAPEQGKRYLNYGCGAWSATIDELRRKGYDVYGFDPYAPCDNKFILTDFEELKKERFDGIFSHDLLEHLRYPLDTFQLFGTILTKDGKMAHSTACYKYVYEYDRFHLVFYTGTSIDELCRKTGFKVVQKYEDHDRLAYNYIYTRA